MAEQTQHFDYLVIGGGSGGVASARRAAEYGAKVALIESSKLGGTCVNVGCVPKKVMWYAAETASHIEHASDYGFSLDAKSIRKSLDWNSLVSRREQYLRRLNGIYANLLDGSNVTVFAGTASFTAEKTVLVSNEDAAEPVQLTAEHILIASGSEAFYPDIPGAELGGLSDDFFALTEQPEKITIIGGGYIAVELCGVLAALGSQVSLVLRSDSVLREFDSMIGEAVMLSLKDLGVQVCSMSPPEAISKQSNGKLKIELYGEHEDLSDQDSVIWAIGRRPLIDGLNLEAIGVKTGEDQRIAVDEYQNTNVENVYAVGDVIGHSMLTPVAIAAGRQLAARLFDNRPEAKFDYSTIPTVVFTHPPTGTVGLSETQAHKEYRHVKVYTANFVPLYYALSEHKVRTAMKLITVGHEERVVGLHVVGMGADEMVQGFAAAMSAGATKQDFDNTLAIHPTSSEEFVTMR